MKRLAVFLLLAASVPAFSQETRSTLTGRVTDSTGAIIPHAQIVVTNSATGVKQTVTSNSAGEYTVPFLLPGPYEVDVTLPGFKTYKHSGLVLQTEQTVTENVVMSIGAVDQTVVVHGDTPLVDTATATTGEVLTSDQVEDLPSNGRSPIGFVHLEYGAVAKGKHSESQVTPFGNSTGSDFSAGGGNSQSNEILMNGVPNMEDGGRISAYSPELDAVDEIKLDEFSANAALGDTSGGIVNITTKGGTNHLHGSASEYYAGSRPFTAKPFYTAPGAVTTSTHFSQFGGTIGGPVVIPHVFNGRDKLFFFYAFEGYIGNSPATVINSVPTVEERAGDFGALLALSPSNQLYNPFTAVTTTKGVSRSPIAGNCIVTSQYCTSTATNASGAPLTLDPVAQAYLKLIPLPNYTGPSSQSNGEDNYFASDPTVNNYKSNQADIDWNISSLNKIRFEAHRSNYAATSGQTFNNILTGTTADTIIWGGQVDDVHTFSPSLSLESRLGFTRYQTSSEPTSVGTNPSTVGMPSYVSSNSTLLALPSFTFSDSSAIQALSGSPGSVEYFDTLQLYESLSKVWGHHTIKVGVDVRSYKESTLSPGAADGTFAFNAGSNSFVTSGPGCLTCTTPGANQLFGGSFALFDLGLPTSGSYNVATKFQYDSWYVAGFAQDDWKILPNLTLSLGLRMDHETPDVESNNHLVSGFDASASNAATAAEEASYAANPSDPLLPVSSYQPTGNVVYATPGNRSAYSTAPVYVSPRMGFAYSPAFSHGSLAIRGGYAVYVNPFGDYTGNWGPSYGFTQSTSYVESNNSMLSPATTLSNPFPTTTSALGGAANPIVQPYGSTYGINTQLGSSITFYAHAKVPYSEKFQFDVQKQFAKSWMVEASYVGDHQVHNNYNDALSSAPLLPYLSRSPQLDPTVNSELSASIANPAYGKLTVGPAATTGLNTSKTTTVGALLQAYPEYTSVTEGLVPGEGGNFNSVLFRVSKRMSYGLQLDFNYIYSRNMGTTTQLNAGGALWYGETSSDFPQHASLTAIYQLPVGKGRMFFHDSTWVDEAFGGWSVTSIYQFLSGTPLQWGNVDYTGNYSNFQLDAHNFRGKTFNTAGFYTGSAQPNGNNFRTFPYYLLRSDPTNNVDFSVLKNFTIKDRIIIQPRVDAFNAFNRPQFGNANVSPTSSAFAEVSSQLNAARSLQGGIHVNF
jgi:hypothetical protein